ncbi:cation-transporting ATPase [Methanocella paludicola SANAE]|uniref:Cation-transporting ATPase n=1 Tax=Methanocella paludicola (strain DSM 17711 / JCM 13418 / NBRC 101707 / SANAE) TaxID=304371 RepID=D1Z227_METPS|nr:HAD-IC family P-type ATPase [Methanocella paludicola]BAI62749.1 cation-transporting ATPase [Methanocella paludicola SANAE]
MFYQKGIDDTFKELRTGSSGLSTEEAKRRLEEYGPNVLEKAEGPSPVQVFIHQFADPLIYILIIAAFITIVLQDWVDTGVILTVITLNAIIGFSQEIKAEQAVRALRSLAAPKAVVIRNGRVEEVDGEELVPGDIVLLTSGTRVPADLRLIEIIRLEVDESAMTGESIPARKMTAPLSLESSSVGDMKNMAFMGTLVVSGRGQGIVTATGAKTQLGSISREVARVRSAVTPLQAKLDHMGRRIGIAVIGVSGIAVVLGIFMGEKLVDMVLTGIALAVGAIPEGLPVVVTITLAIGVKRMADKNAILRRLHAVETLGSTTVIASDKTGTMTKNEMTVVRIFAGGRLYSVTGTGFSPDGEIVPGSPGGRNMALEMCLRAGLMANESGLEFDEKKKTYVPRGDPTEVSLIVSAIKGGFREGEERVKYVDVDEIPFESERMYMATLHSDPDGKGHIAFIKGAPDRILGMCDRELGQDGMEAGLDKGRVAAENDSMGSEGLRILAMAYKKFPADVTGIEPSMLESGSVFLGIQGMYDPPREEVHEAIQQAKRSGIRVVMVTGDHKVTALSIARKLDIVDDENAAVLTGQDLEPMTDEELYEQVGRVSVFSRVSPIHKLRIVQQLIKRGEIVAVTGDGVNDTPALKAAHIGVAMGKSGTDAAKETAEMVITDDNFASIFAAVKEGRVVFANIRKVVLFLLSSGLGQVIFILATLVMRLPLPLLPSQIIWMNLVTNGLQDVAMSFEPAEKGIEYQKPRPRNEPIISRLMMERLVVIGIVLAAGSLALFVWELGQGSSIEKARTEALTVMVFYQLFNVFNARSETRSAFRMNPLANPFLFFSIVASIIAQFAVIYWAPLQYIFRTTPLGLKDWLLILPVAFTVIIVVEIDKAVRRIMAKK